MASPDLERMEILKQTGEKATGAVIFLHGSGDNGAKLKSQMEEFMEATGGAIGHPFVKMYFPTAPEKHITLRDKMVTSWFDGMRTGRKVEDVDCNYDDCDNSATFLIQLIEMIEVTGIPRNRIVLAGISQGAMQAMYTAFTKVAARGIAGLIVMATVFPFVKAKMLKPPHPPLYHFHGAQDPIVPLKGVKMAESLLNFYGVKVNLQILPESTHELDEHYVKRFLNTLDNLIPRDFESS